MKDEEPGVAVSDGHGELPIVPVSPDQINVGDDNKRDQGDHRALEGTPGDEYQIPRKAEITQKSQKKREGFERQGEVVIGDVEACRGCADRRTSDRKSAQKP